MTWPRRARDFARASRSSMASLERQLEEEFRSDADRALDADHAAVGLDDLLADEQAQTMPVVRLAHRAAPCLVEQMLELCGRDARAVITHRDPRRLRRGRERYGDARVFRGVDERVVHEVRDHALDP